MRYEPNTETVCHCGHPDRENTSDHCGYCGCETYEATCESRWSGKHDDCEMGCAA